MCQNYSLRFGSTVKPVWIRQQQERATTIISDFSRRARVQPWSSRTLSSPPFITFIDKPPLLTAGKQLFNPDLPPRCRKCSVSTACVFVDSGQIVENLNSCDTLMLIRRRQGGSKSLKHKTNPLQYYFNKFPITSVSFPYLLNNLLTVKSCTKNLFWDPKFTRFEKLHPPPLQQ